jgi:hypothetical protein
MKTISILAASACIGLFLANSDPLAAQTAQPSAKSDQDLAKENAALRRQNAELLNRLRRLETQKGAPATASGTAHPQSPATSAMAASFPVKAPLAARQTTPAASGYIEVYTGGAWTKDSANFTFGDTADETFNGWVLGGAGRGNWWITPNVSAQFDAQAEGTQYKIPDDFLEPGFSGHFSTLNYLIGAHANWRDPSTGLIGIVGGVGDVSGHASTRAIFSQEGVRHGLIGAEGQYYWNALTLYAQGGYDSTFNIGGFALFDNVHAWYLRGTGRYFFMPNFMVEGTAQYANGAIGYNSTVTGSNSDTAFNTWLWRIKAEWKPDSLPVSFFATYQGSQTHYDPTPFLETLSERMTDNRVTVGLRLYMGQDTLLANDRTGATLDIIDPLGAATSPLMIMPAGQELKPSDARLKRDIVLVGRLDDGLGLYRYRYLWSDTVYVGVMAQEVALIHPDAVVRGSLDGYLRVNYSRLGLTLMTLPEWDARNKDERL